MTLFPPVNQYVEKGSPLSQVSVFPDTLTVPLWACTSGRLMRGLESSTHGIIPNFVASTSPAVCVDVEVCSCMVCIWLAQLAPPFMDRQTSIWSRLDVGDVAYPVKVTAI